MSQNVTIINPSLGAFIAEIQEKVQEGYEVDFENHYPCMWGIVYEARMIRKEDAVPALLKVLPIIPQPTPEKRSGRPAKAVQ